MLLSLLKFIYFVCAAPKRFFVATVFQSRFKYMAF